MSLATKIYYKLPNAFKSLALSSSLYLQNNIRYGSYYKKYLKVYAQNLSKTENELTKYQLNELKKLLLESNKYSAYYQNLFLKNGITAEKISQSENAYELLSNIPFLTKKLQKQYNSTIQNSRRKSSYLNFTSGTSGSPAVIAYDDESFQIGFALWRRFHNWIGLPQKFKSVRLSGKIIVQPSKTKPPFWVNNLASNQLFMSVYHLTPENMPHYIKKLNSYKPEFIDAYPSAIFILAQFINKNKIKLNFKPISIATTAETLYAHYRTEIEQAFGCKVFNQYSSSEGGPFINECSNGKLHINVDSGVFEFFNAEGKPAKEGEMAELVITSLRQWKTPLIRYKTGDWVKLLNQSFTYQYCECGSCMPIVDEIIGRQEDILYTKERGYVGRMDPAYKGLIGIVKSRIIQHSVNELEVQNVVDNNYNDTIESTFIKNLRDRLGSEIKIEIKKLKEISLGPNGKFKAVERKFSLQ